MSLQTGRVYSEWSSWTECRSNCKTSGKQKRTRECLRPKSSGLCNATNEMVRSCLPDKCSKGNFLMFMKDESFIYNLH